MYDIAVIIVNHQIRNLAISLLSRKVAGMILFYIFIIFILRGTTLNGNMMNKLDQGEMDSRETR